MNHKSVSLVCSSLLLLLWVYAGVSKLLTIGVFAYQIKQSTLIAFAAPFLSYALPLAELVLALLLLMESTRKTGFLLSLVLLLAFILYITAVLLWSPVVPCSCGGVISKMSWEQHIFFNAAFVLVSSAGLRAEMLKKNWKMKTVIIH